MIARISGKLIERRQQSVLLEIGGLGYEVLVPDAVMQALDECVQSDGTLTLVTFHYLQSDPSRSVPVLIGFLHEIEREFFERFITVSGVGPRGALRALSLPISAIARAIDAGDTALLRSLPGIGEQRAREIVAKLQGKLGKFGLMKEEMASARAIPVAGGGVKEQALAVLEQLQYRRREAEIMVEQALARRPDMKSVEELLNEVYHQRQAEAVR